MENPQPRGFRQAPLMPSVVVLVGTGKPTFVRER